MHTKTFCSRLLVPALVVFAMSAWTGPVSAQKKIQASPGASHGEMDYPISWKQYYSYAEKTKLMQGLQKQYSHLADISSIGKSRMGRDQWMLTITSKATGAADTKPAMWVDGAIHGNEMNGVTCSLYLAWYLVTRYDYDPYVHNLVDRQTFYILPGLNVDANDSYVTEPNTENNPREPYRAEDNDGDGLYDEDLTEDVDGDGEISVMWVEDPAGDFKLSPDKRRFVRVTDPREEGLRFRRIGMEGYDNDGDGRINEDDLGGPDPNRNFPFGWGLQDGWPYPMSESETRNVFEFQLKHPNIFASFHFHNTGRLIMFMAPPDVRATTMTPEQRTAQEARVAAQLAEMRKTDRYAQLFPRVAPPELQNDMDTQLAIVTEGAHILKDYTPTFSGLSGQAQAASYNMLGAYAYLIELWGPPPLADADRNGDGRVDEEELQAWMDTELTGEGWIAPHKFRHPDLGDIWIGGSARKHTGRTPPAPYMEAEALKQTHFVLYSASQFPKVEIDRVAVTPATGDLFWIDATVKNDRVYPTSSDRSLQLKRAVTDRLTLSFSPNVTFVEVPAGVVRLDPLNEQAAAAALTARTTEFRLRGRDSVRFRGLVRMTGADGWVEVKTESKFGGTDTRRIEIKVSGS
ncbi:MAG TPA: M14 family metallopeptidase [Vicinamibacterales bacterium]